MNTRASLFVQQEETGNLVVEGLGPSEGPWQAQAVAEGRVLLRRTHEAPGQISSSFRSPSAWGEMPAAGLANLLQGLHHEAWTGMVAVDTGFGVKRLYLREGALIFAASSAIDDRLGEIIYRDGLISLDDLTQSAAKVTRSMKFGQVLLRSGIFDSLALWRALCLQVRQIVHSVFMVERVFAEVIADEAPATEVAFAEGTGRFIESALTFGAMFRNFSGRLNADTRIQVLESGDSEALFYPQGTFLGDFLSLLRDNATIENIVGVSKVQLPYTLATLLLLVNRGACALQGVDAFALPAGRAELLPLRSRLNAYQFLLQESRSVFAAERVAFPAAALNELALSFSDDALPVFFLGPDAELDEQALAYTYSQCVASKSRVAIFAAFVDCLIGFLLHLADDQLSPVAATRIRDIYHRIGSL